MSRQCRSTSVRLRLLELLEGIQSSLVRFVVLLLPRPVAAFLISLVTVITTEAGPRAVIAVPLVVDSLRNRLGPSRPKEQ